MIELGTDVVVAALEQRYREVSSAISDARARYLVLREDPLVARSAVDQALNHWQELIARRRALAARVHSLHARHV